MFVLGRRRFDIMQKARMWGEVVGGSSPGLLIETICRVPGMA